MKKDEILKSLKEFSQKPIFPKILISVGLVIMVMIVFADFSGSKDKKSVSDTDADFQTADTYIECTESRLSEVLMSIEGVGKAKSLSMFPPPRNMFTPKNSSRVQAARKMR